MMRRLLSYLLAAVLSAAPVLAQAQTVTSYPPTTANTIQPFSDNSNAIATDLFVQGRAALANSFTPFSNITGGTYSFATLGSGCVVVFTASGGVLSGVITIGVAGSGYAVGDVLTPKGGNTDAYIRVTGVSSGGVTAVQILYGGTGYSTGGSLQLSPAQTFPAVFSATGTLTSNVTVIVPNGTFLLGGQERTVANNTTGAFTTTLCISNGANACTGTTLVIPQGTANNTPIYWFTDGSTGIWQINNYLGAGAVAATNGTATGLTLAGTTTLPLSGTIQSHLTGFGGSSPIISGTDVLLVSGTGTTRLESQSLGGQFAVLNLGSGTSGTHTQGAAFVDDTANLFNVGTLTATPLAFQINSVEVGRFEATAGKFDLGKSGTNVGTLVLNNATSGTISLQPPTGALGSAVLTVPDATDQLVGRATTDTLTNKTFNTTGTGNVFQANGVTATLANRTRQVLTSGSGATYTTPANVRQLLVRACAGGGGGGGTGSTGPNTGGTGGTTIFNAINANGGGGAGAVAGAGGTGGTGTATNRYPGAPGQMFSSNFASATNAFFVGGSGGGSGGGIGTNGAGTGTAGAANSGGGGSGAGLGSTAFATLANDFPGSGGGQGECFDLIINAPSATYTYTVGAAGTAGSAGTGGSAGGAGGTGYILVDEFY